MKEYHVVKKNATRINASGHVRMYQKDGIDALLVLDPTAEDVRDRWLVVIFNKEE